MIYFFLEISSLEVFFLEEFLYLEANSSNLSEINIPILKNFNTIPNDKTIIPIIKAIKKTEYALENKTGRNCKKEKSKNERRALTFINGNDEIINKEPVTRNKLVFCSTKKKIITIKNNETKSEK